MSPPPDTDKQPVQLRDAVCINSVKRCSSSVSAASRVLAFLVLAFFLIAGNAWAQITCPPTLSDPPTDKQILLKLYCDTDGPSWANSTNWGSSAALNEWGLVTIGGDPPKVIFLQLAHNRLSGPIPSELGKLGSLEHLQLSNNQLSGAIPSELGKLDSLERLQLSNNQLSGTIPSELGKLGKLQDLSLGHNRLSGPIPPELGKLGKLQFLYLNSNQLSGAIPPELGKLDKLQVLSLNGNQLSGAIPSELGKLDSLTHLIFADNQLSGAIPSELESLSSLQILYLNGNQLSGAIPPELGKLGKLQFLYLNLNQLSGAIPPELGNLSNLELLYLHDNPGLTGELPLGLMESSLKTLNIRCTDIGVPDDEGFKIWLAGIRFTDSNCPTPPPPTPPPPTPPPPLPPPDSDCDGLSEDRGENGLVISPGCVDTSLIEISSEEGKYITIELSVAGDEEPGEMPSVILSSPVVERVETVSFELSVPSQEQLPEELRIEGFVVRAGIGSVTLGEDETVAVCLPASEPENAEEPMPGLYRYDGEDWVSLSDSGIETVNDMESLCADTSSLPSLFGVFISEEVPAEPTVVPAGMGEQESSGGCSVASGTAGGSAVLGAAFSLLLIMSCLLTVPRRRRKDCV